MKRPFHPMTLLLAMALAAPWCTPLAQTPPPIDDELVRMRKELVQAQLDCQRTGLEMDKDKKDFEAYRARTSQRLAQGKQQLDGLKAETGTQALANNALAAQIGGIQAQRREIELSQDEFRKRLIALCASVQPVVKKLPPLIMTPTLSSLSLLSSDLSTRSIDIVEGCTRLVQVLGRLDEASSGIQIAQESSPVADIRGTVYRLRIGSFFEAVVDVKGEKCALFEGWNAAGAPRWKTLESAATASALLLAINIREGKSLPALVNIPLASEAAAAQGGAR